MSVKNAQSAYKADRDSCNALSGNAKDICMEAAKGKEKIAKAEAEAAYKNTPKARESARVAPGFRLSRPTYKEGPRWTSWPGCP